MQTFPMPVSELRSLADVAEALNRVTSQLNSCSVALRNLDYDTGFRQTDTCHQLLLNAFCDTYTVYARILAATAVSDLARTLKVA